MALNVVALAGGVGGAKLALGLAQSLPPETLTVLVNVADDFHLYDLHIAPDLDTVMYTLAGMVNPETGWGIAGDTTHTLEMLARYGEETWFKLGDRDFATHLLRTARLNDGDRLTEITQAMCAMLGVAPRLLPVTDDEIATLVNTVDGETLGFQEYFVRRRWQPVVEQLYYAGTDHARLSPEVVGALDEAELVVFCPSNPLLSIDPMLAVGNLDHRLARLAGIAVRVAVSPIVAGRAIKGPAAKLMGELGLEASPVGVAAHYDGLLDGFVLDNQDAGLAPRIKEELGMATLVTDTVMKTAEDKQRLAEEIIMWSESL